MPSSRLRYLFAVGRRTARIEQVINATRSELQDRIAGARALLSNFSDLPHSPERSGAEKELAHILSVAEAELRELDDAKRG